MILNLNQAQKTEKEDEVEYMEYAMRQKLENICRMCMKRLDCKVICDLKRLAIKEAKQ